ncbi:tRNA preQ1(34) S-adenosylmethionine ribosyltransferase-isomerase QueA [Sphaerothrix gracilis]|uniref:tRNA preQ1(34) S-adenosylmethionine ribosyltransferase-isomerase QueA n=1 Tax=Sphaerothrix gracilis TaxID=3151835 RepID=UPI0031FCE0EA
MTAADFSADLLLDAYQYSLPAERIAQNPVVPRDRARLMVVDSPSHHVHSHFYDLPSWLKPGDLLVFNNTQVIPARLYGRKTGGAAVEILLLEARAPLQWLALVKPGKRLKPGATIVFGDDEQAPQLVAQVMAVDESTGGRLLQFELPTGLSFAAAIAALGQVPLPPYITDSQATPEQYQTIYAETPGAVAAPTAGLHFTPDVFQALDQKGIHRAFLTLHVGLGTFRPVEVSDITTHAMHAEWIDISAAVVSQIQQTKAQGGRVIAVGTTVTRALEGAAQSGELSPFQGKTNIFIYPGYRWRVVDGLITNFHLPGSSLLMLVSALVGRSRLMRLYAEAIAQTYRFYSFGDAMLILPEAKTS